MDLPPSTDLLAIVAIINAVGSVIALIIHAIRVPYRESSAKEAAQADIAATVLRQAENGHAPTP